ncbi:CD59 glycoprotein-like [Arapaima gigas]
MLIYQDPQSDTGSRTQKPNRRAPLLAVKLNGGGSKMKRLGLLVFSFAAVGLVSGLRCYKCTDVSQKCSTVQTCSYEDACLFFSEGGRNIRQCIRYTDCNIVRIKQMFALSSTFKYQCCTTNLCNSNLATSLSKPLLGLLALPALFWHCVL